MGNEKSNGKKEQMAETAVATLAKKFGYVTEGKYKGCDVSLGNEKGNDKLKNFFNLGYLRSGTNEIVFIENKKFKAKPDVRRDIKVVDLIDITDDVFKVSVKYKDGDFSEINFHVSSDPKGALGFVKKYFSFFINAQNGKGSEKVNFAARVASMNLALDEDIKNFKKEKENALADKDTEMAEANDNKIKEFTELRSLLRKDASNAAKVVYDRRNFVAFFYLPGLNVSREAEEKLDKYFEKNGILGVMKLLKTLISLEDENVQNTK